MASKYSISKVEKCLDELKIEHFWRRRGSRVYLVCDLQRETNALIISIRIDKLEFHLSQFCPKSRLTSKGKTTATFFMYDLIDLLKNVDNDSVIA